ncbi:Hpt domain-containing protein, partial [Azonexus sp.]|uniref:Hpt domain-containing protein n=1 Tax=Azonexus sp. TaxID=1872668 RepID=UPI0035B16B64
EVVQNGLTAIAALDSDPGNLGEMTTLRRAFHTLKGSSRMVGLTEFGEAAWSMEQLLNTWLADQKPATDELRSVSGDAMRAFGRWTEDIATGADAGWKAGVFRTSAEGLRLEGRVVPLALPEAAVAVEPLPAVDPLANLFDDLPAVAAAADPVATPGPAPSAEVDPFAFDLGSADIEVAEAAAMPGSDLGADFNFDIPAVTDSPAAVAATPAEPVSVAAVADLPMEIDGIDFDSLSAVSGMAESAPVTAAVPEPLPDFDLPELTAPEPTPVAEPAPVATASDEQVKVIGSLRIGIPLYNVYLNEADEWIRRLGTELTEWSLELNQPVPDSTVGLAHALAGSSATVGFHALSDMARALENALLQAQPQSRGLPAQAEAFMAAAEDIRRLLHQFAAGFLKEPDPQVLQALLALKDLDVPPELLEVPEPPEPVASDPDVFDVPDFSMTAALAGAAVTDKPVPPAELPPVAAPAVEAPFGMAEPAPLQPAPPQRAAAFQDIGDEDDDFDVTDAIDQDLFPIFEEEAVELMPQLGGALRQWAARPDNRGAREEVLRALHTLKGSARLAGALRLGEMAHRMESEIEQLDAGPQAGDLEPLLHRFDGLQANFDTLRATGGVSAPVADASPAHAAAVEPAAVADAPAQRAMVALPATSVLAPMRAAANQA